MKSWKHLGFLALAFCLIGGTPLLADDNPDGASKTPEELKEALSASQKKRTKKSAVAAPNAASPGVAAKEKRAEKVVEADKNSSSRPYVFGNMDGNPDPEDNIFKRGPGDDLMGH